MDLIVDLIDQLILLRIRQSAGYHVDEEIAVLKEKLRRILNENIPNK